MVFRARSTNWVRFDDAWSRNRLTSWASATAEGLPAACPRVAALMEAMQAENDRDSSSAMRVGFPALRSPPSPVPRRARRAAIGGRHRGSRVGRQDPIHALDDDRAPPGSWSMQDGAVRPLPQGCVQKRVLAAGGAGSGLAEVGLAHPSGGSPGAAPRGRFDRRWCHETMPVQLFECARDARVRQPGPPPSDRLRTVPPEPPAGGL